VSEGTGANLFLAKDGKLRTPRHSDDILDGVTRAHVMRLAHDLGIPVEERALARAELYGADEAFFCGTGAEITAIGRVDHVPVGNGELGPIVKAVKERFQQSVRGKLMEYQHLLTAVPEECPLVMPAKAKARGKA
jgi:branched-chain amino acid aminotransferase